LTDNNPLSQSLENTYNQFIMCRQPRDAYNLSMTSLDVDCPKTPQEYIDMIIDRHSKTRHQRLGTWINNVKCRNPCEKAIRAVKYTNKLGNQTRKRDSLRRTSHHAIRLSDEVKAIMSEGPEFDNDEQLDAIASFKELLEDKATGSLLRRLGWYDASSVSKDQMKYLMKLLSAIFFRDYQMELDFEWKTYNDDYFGRYTCDVHPKIEMSAFNYMLASPHGNLSARTMSRLSTLLHELVHAYLGIYACRCPSFVKDVESLKGHGLAWQRIASSVEHNAPRFIHLPLVLGRFTSIQANWGVPLYWPTQQEVKEWNLERMVT
ncbi:uncharacterized protein J4E92_007585, partial [Alternaria infectoria]|uniref:uncharacterized protein n=1 Tax=Alternaria infectoria TaxID=45303 RepID=UPI00221F7DCD